MTGKTEHHNKNFDDNAPKHGSGIDQPLGVDKESLEKAADEILAGNGEEGAEIIDGAGDPLAMLVEDLKVVHAEKDELQNQYLLTVAEMENLRKRTRKEIADTREYSVASFARDMLSVTDNLRRAIEAVPQEEIDADKGGLKNLVEGVLMTERELLSAMEKHKVKKMSPMGEKFDPNFHQAMFEVQNKDVNNNTVVEVIQDGYVIGERMLRPAMVGVAKGGPKTPKPSVDDNSEEISE